MAQVITIEDVYKEVKKIEKDMGFVKHAIAEDFELSKEAKKQLEESRKTPRAEYISQKDIEKEFLR